MKHINIGMLAALALIGGSLVTIARAEDTASERQTTSGPQLVTGTSFDLILAALEENDFEGELTKDDEGDPLIKSTDEDVPFSIHFYGCTDGKDCKYIQFTSGWDLKKGISLDKIEAWNKTKVWGQAYRDKEKDPYLGMTVNLVGGVTVENFNDTVDWWRVILDQFEEHIGWKSN